MMSLFLCVAVCVCPPCTLCLCRCVKCVCDLLVSCGIHSVRMLANCLVDSDLKWTGQENAKVRGFARVAAKAAARQETQGRCCTGMSNMHPFAIRHLHVDRRAGAAQWPWPGGCIRYGG